MKFKCQSGKADNFTKNTKKNCRKDLIFQAKRNGPRAILFCLVQLKPFGFLCLLVLQQDLGGVAVVDHRDH
jgi:hypothetical protein